MLSPEKYAEYDGGQCPRCGTTDVGYITALELENGGSMAMADVSCNNCGSMWTDVFRLVGYDNFEKNARNRLNGETKGQIEKE